MIALYDTPWTRQPLAAGSGRCGLPPAYGVPVTTIPILDLTRARKRIDVALRERWNKILDTNSYIQGRRSRSSSAPSPASSARAPWSVSGTAPTRWSSPCGPCGSPPAPRCWCRRSASSPPPRRWCSPAACRSSATIDAATYNLDPEEPRTPRHAEDRGRHRSPPLRPAVRHRQGPPRSASAAAGSWSRIGAGHGAKRRGRRVGPWRPPAWSCYRPEPRLLRDGGRSRDGRESS